MLRGLSVSVFRLRRSGSAQSGSARQVLQSLRVVGHPRVMGGMLHVVSSCVNAFRSICHTLSLVNTGRKADHLLCIAEPIACKEASLIDASSYPWTPSSTFYKLLEIEHAVFRCRDQGITAPGTRQRAGSLVTISAFPRCRAAGQSERFSTQARGSKALPRPPGLPLLARCCTWSASAIGPAARAAARSSALIDTSHRPRSRCGARVVARDPRMARACVELTRLACWPCRAASQVRRFPYSYAKHFRSS
jgi:hypothetical protein